MAIGMSYGTAEAGQCQNAPVENFNFNLCLALDHGGPSFWVARDFSVGRGGCFLI